MTPRLTRREMLQGSMAMAAFAFAQTPLGAFGFDDPEPDTTLIPFLDKQSGTNGIQWEKLSSWITPSEQLYKVQHYGVPKVDLAAWQLEIGGLVRKPQRLTLAQLRQRRLHGRHRQCGVDRHAVGPVAQGMRAL